MNNTRLSKLLSVILAVAICATTVFGCLMTVNAATPASYEIVADEVTDLTQASASITFSVPEGMSAGMFDLANTAKGDFAGVTAVITGGTKLNGEADIENDFATYEDENGGVFNPFLISTEDLDDGDLARVIFMLSNPAAENLYTSVTFKFTITFDGEATKGAEYDLAINDLEFMAGYGGTNEVVYDDSDFDGKPAKISTGCEHVVVVNDEDLLKTDSVNGYAVYSKSSCAKCLEELGYQVVPTKVPAEPNVIYWDGTEVEPTTDSNGDGVIEINSASEIAWLAKNPSDNTAKYKVADGIDAIILQLEEVATLDENGNGIYDIMECNSYKETKSFVEHLAELDVTIKSWYTKSLLGTVGLFGGTFDGNGVEIYGMFTNATWVCTGLFPAVTTGAVIKNVSIKNSYLSVTNAAGALYGFYYDSQLANATGSVTIEKCMVANSWIYNANYQNNKGEPQFFNDKTGAFGGAWQYQCTKVSMNISNCITYGNSVTNARGDDLGIFGTLANDRVNTFANLIILDTAPIVVSQANSVAVGKSGDKENVFSNFYTNHSLEVGYQYNNGRTNYYDGYITKISSSDIKGEKASETLQGFDFDTVWATDVNGGYPLFAQEVSKPGSEAGEVIKWQYKDWGSGIKSWFDEDLADNEETGDNWDNAIIIDNPGELAWVIGKGGAVAGKYYKVADGIAAFDMNASVDMSGDMTPAQVEAALATGSWLGSGWGTTTFAGAGFDGNGVVIYGIQGSNGSNGAAALFHKVKPGVTIKNLTLKNSYFRGDASGALFSNVDGTDAATITVENVVLTGNVVVSCRNNGAESYGGVMYGRAGSCRVHVNNCLVYNNVAKHQGFFGDKTGYDVTYGLMGNASKVDGVNSKLENSIVLDCLPFTAQYSYSSTSEIDYVNVYTNMTDVQITNTMKETSGEIVYTTQYTSGLVSQGNGKYKIVAELGNRSNSGSTTSLSKTKATDSIYPINAKDIKGLGGGAVVSALNTANNATVWATTASGYPTPMAKYADTISAMSSLDLKLAAYNLTYNESGSFNLNYHYEPAYEDFAPELLIAKSDLSKFTALAPIESPYAGNGLSDDAIMYTIENISAREIEDTMLATLIVPNGDQAIWGKTEAISAKDYAIKVINGEAFYTAGADAATSQKDKNVAAALINYGEAAKIALNTANDANKTTGTTIYWDGTVASGIADDTSATDATKGTASNPIIINTAKELAYLVSKAGTASDGVYYKMADDISTIILQPEGTAAADVLNLADAQAVRNHFESNPSGIKAWKVTAAADAFLGNFDGNGVTIYGLYSTGTPTGLFSRTDKNVTISNVNLKNCYCKGYRGGILVGQTITNTASTITTIENASIVNCVSIGWNNTSVTLTASTLLGYINNVAEVNNFITYGCIAKYEGPKGQTTEGMEGLLTFAYVGQHNSTPWLNNSIVLDVAPYATLGRYTDKEGVEHFANTKGWVTADKSMFANVYTNMPTEGLQWLGTNDTVVDYPTKNIKHIENIDLQGSNVVATIENNETANSITNGFDWNVWAYGANGEYPTLVKASTETEGKILYWDGGETAPTKIDSDGNKLITTPEELYYLAKNGDTSATSKYKIADGIKAFIMQPDTVVDATELMSLSGHAETKAYFDKLNAANAGLKSWTTKAANAATGTEFAGTFDGNGVEIYGLYYNKHSWASTGLFPHVGANVVIKNLAIKNSYLAIQSYAGALYGQSITGGNSDRIYIDSVEVSNSWFYNTEATTKNPGAENEYIQYFTNRTGILSGNTQGLISINNCIIYGNKIMNANNVELKLAFGTLKNSWTTTDLNHSYSNSIVLGQFPFDGTAYNSMLAGLFANVYTDQDTTTGRYKYTADQIAQVESADMIGGNAQTVVDAINNANGDSRDMYVGNAWGYPGFTQAGIMPSANQMAFDNLVLTNTDTYGAYNPEFSMYATSLNLKANPYIAFTFAFNGEYKAHRDNITVTFTNYKGQQIGESTTVGNGNGGVSTGWTNNAGAGRYHLYRLKNIDVKDLAAGITVNVSYGGDTYNFGTFSVEGFALDSANALKKNPDSKYYAANLNAAKALLYYVQTVSARYGA